MEAPLEPASMLPAQEDFEAIMQSALDYVEGWYEADADRMRRCLHSDLVKRTIVREPGQEKWEIWRPTTAPLLIAYTQDGGGSHVPEGERSYQITIQDIFRHVATAKCISPLYVDYLQLAKIDGRWLIVNVLWEVREGETAPWT